MEKLNTYMRERIIFIDFAPVRQVNYKNNIKNLLILKSSTPQNIQTKTPQKVSRGPW